MILKPALIRPAYEERQADFAAFIGEQIRLEAEAKALAEGKDLLELMQNFH